MVILSHKLYVIGGYNDDGPLSSVECFNIRNKKWKEQPGLQEPRFQLGAVASAGKIYAIGGRDDLHSLSSVEVFHRSQGTWVQLGEHMNEARCAFGLILHKKMIYCFGGRGQQSIERYDLTTGEWSPVGRMSLDQSSISLSCVLYPPLFT